MRRTWATAVATAATCLVSALAAASCAPAEAERTRTPAEQQASDLSQSEARDVLRATLRGAIAGFPASPDAFGAFDGPMFYPARVSETRYAYRLEESARFYRDALGLPEITGQDVAAPTPVSEDGAPTHRIFGSDNGHFVLRAISTPVNGARDIEAVGWGVRDIDRVAAALAARGVRPILHPGAQHAGNGVWTAPNGDRVLWFADPDGYPLAVVQQKPF